MLSFISLNLDFIFNVSISRSNPSAIKSILSFPHAPCRLLSELHGAVSHEGHLDVVCASSQEAKPPLVLLDTEGLGDVEKVKK